MRLSDRIRHARRLRGLSQADVARALAVDRSAVGHWERGSGCTPSGGRLLALAALVGVRSEWLADGLEPMLTSAASTPQSAVPLSDDETRLLRAWRELPVRKRMALLDLAEPPPACVMA